MGYFKYKQVKFDDYHPYDKPEWSPICNCCLSKYEPLQSDVWEEYGVNGGICGVKGCDKEADYYIDFEYCIVLKKPYS